MNICVYKNVKVLKSSEIGDYAKKIWTQILKFYEKKYIET